MAEFAKQTGSLLRASEVAALLGVPTSWVYEQSRRGRIPTVTLGRYRRYRRAAIDAWIYEIEVTGRPLSDERIQSRSTGRAISSGDVSTR